MLELIPKEDLGYEPNFDWDSYCNKFYDDTIDKMMRRSSTSETKEQKKARIQRFIDNNSKENFIEKKDLFGDYQVIPRELWLNKEYFDGGSVMARLHPHFQISFYDAVNKTHSTNDTLLLINCRESKPYSKEQTVKMHVKYAQQLGWDVAVLSATICPTYPYDASRTYPFNIYNWPGNRNGQYNELVCQQTDMQLGYMLSKHRYKKVILISSGNWHYQTQFDSFTNQFPHVKFLHIGGDNGFPKQILTQLIGNKGLSSTRFTHNFICRIILFKMMGYDPDELLGKTKNYFEQKERLLQAAKTLRPHIESWEDIYKEVEKEWQ